MTKLKQETKQKIIKITIIIVALLLIFLAIYLPLELTGTLEKINSAEKLKDVILSFGAYSYIIFFIIQFLQTTIIPLPAAITTIAGTLLFGPWITLGISFLAVFSGSLFAFFLGKKIGRRLVVWVAGEKTTLKWEEKLKQGKFVYFLMMLLPLFPDDILCIVAGTVNMSYRFFIITNLITRPISIATTCFLGSGHIIPYSGWGIPVWIALVIICIILFYLSYKYQPQIENFVVNLGKKLTNKGKKEPNNEQNLLYLPYQDENKKDNKTNNNLEDKNINEQVEEQTNKSENITEVENIQPDKINNPRQVNYKIFKEIIKKDINEVPDKTDKNKNEKP